MVPNAEQFAELQFLNDKIDTAKHYDRWLRGNDIGSGSVCFDFRSTNVVQLSMSSKVA